MSSSAACAGIQIREGAEAAAGAAWPPQHVSKVGHLSQPWTHLNVCHACKDVLLELVWLAESVTDLNVLAARVFWVHTGI